jgi:hypothetical protein
MSVFGSIKRLVEELTQLPGLKRYFCWLIWMPTVLSKSVCHRRGFFMAVGFFSNRYDAANWGPLLFLLGMFGLPVPLHHQLRKVSLGDAGLGHALTIILIYPQAWNYNQGNYFVRIDARNDKIFYPKRDDR